MVHTVWIFVVIILLSLLSGRICNYFAWQMMQQEQKNNYIVILLTGVMFLSLTLRFGIKWELAQFGLLGCLLIVMAVIDYEIWIIPDRLLVVGLVLYFPFCLLYEQPVWDWFLQGLWGGCSVAVPLLLFVLAADHLLQKETMGGGDIKLFFLLGVYLGPLQTVLTLYLSCLIGLFWQILQKRLEPGRPFPFGPSIALAVWVSLLWGPSFIQWYLQFP